MGREYVIDGESKGAFRERMVRTGLWEEFKQERQWLVDGGMASSDAWAELRKMEKYRKGGHADVVLEEQERLEVAREEEFGQARSADEGGGRLPSMFDRQEWVYENVANPDPKIGDAPSPGAWAQLKEVQKNQALRQDFYRTIVPKMLPSKQELDAMDFADPNRTAFERLEAILRRFQEEQEGEDGGYDIGGRFRQDGQWLPDAGGFDGRGSADENGD